MTAEQYQALRRRSFTHAEMVSFAEFYALHKYENSIDNLIAKWMNWTPEQNVNNKTMDILLLIEKTVADYYGISLSEIRCKFKYRDYATARQVIAYFAVDYARRKDIALTYACLLNSVTQRVLKCRGLLEVDKKLKADVDALDKHIRPEIEKLLNPIES